MEFDNLACQPGWVSEPSVNQLDSRRELTPATANKHCWSPHRNGYHATPMIKTLRVATIAGNQLHRQEAVLVHGATLYLFRTHTCNYITLEFLWKRLIYLLFKLIMKWNVKSCVNKYTFQNIFAIMQMNFIQFWISIQNVITLKCNKVPAISSLLLS